MTPEEYIQVKAFARQDGALLSVLWIASFACYIYGMQSPVVGLAAMAMIVLTPFFVSSRLRHFRDYGREGIISVMRGYGYSVLVFFYAGLLLAAAQYVYFAYIDHGYLVSKISEAIASPEGQQAIQQMGMAADVEQGMASLAEMRPIDYALNILSVNIIVGLLLSIPIAFIMARKPRQS